ncbi:aminodeoxychorismate synthase component I [Kitasatospora sp. NPDC049258]|uniref:aminodeoxychorismate synthase component I n=1 Tax=Kitasatospora sp. NPDC049258 TaxID=3155394 RepID=UPI003442BF90
MRILLVDNYDSFTFNLFHHLAEVGGQEPVVVVNDDPDWRYEQLAGFDAVVISPGPGSPDRPADFGICAEILAKGELPVLGVCLGHQGIAALHGGRVERAPEPFHGRNSAVHHDGTGLFEGLPSPLDAVRYHSLTVQQLSPLLEATAWTDDGLLMGLRHRDLPLWGVQFHPESIGGDDGRLLLANFLRLAADHNRRTGRVTRPAHRVPPEPEQRFLPRRRLRVLTRAMPTRWDDEVAFDRLFRGGPYAYWLDSSRPDEHAGRFSVMGDASGPLGRVAVADVERGTVTVHAPTGTEVVPGPFLDWVDRDLRDLRTEVPELPFDFALGWVGYLGYELKAECGGDLAHHSDTPDAVLAFSGRALVLDHATGTSHLLALAEEGGEAQAQAWLDLAAERLALTEGRRLHLAGPPLPFGPLTARHDQPGYLGLVDACLREIEAGESYEVCLTNMLEAPGPFDPWEGYRYLRRISPAPYAALLSFGDLAVLSTSPERFLKVDRTGLAESRPIKGTRPRGASHREDRALVEELRTSEKDRAENLMIVDLVRNDLGRCAEIGSVRATELFTVESYAKAHQLVSVVQARLRPQESAVSCVRAAFPPGSMTGAPKRRTMQIIDRLEQGPRGVYSGAIGYFSLTGAADLSVVIRTVVATPGRVRYGVGGAVIALSDPEGEFLETAVKAAPMVALAGAEFPVGRQLSGRAARPDQVGTVRSRDRAAAPAH